jgi:hypothetical protein
MRSRTTVPCILTILAAVAACELRPRSSVGVDDAVTQVVVSPDSTMLDPSQSFQFRVYGRTEVGDSVPVSVRWAASAGIITSAGLYTADTSAADVVVTATLTNSTVSASSNVKKRRVIAIFISPKRITVPAGASQQFAVYGRRNSGDSVTVSVSYAATGGTVSGSGAYTAGQSAGNYRVIADQKGGSLADTSVVTVTTMPPPPPPPPPVPVASVAVTPPSNNLFVGQTVQLSVTTKDSVGNVLTGRTILWGSSGTTVATVSASGLVTAKAAGSATITATSEGRSATAAVTATVAPVASVTLTPAPVSVTVGQTVQLTATPKDANGNPLAGRVVTWATSNATVASVSTGGLVSGLLVGTATITATSEGQGGSSATTVVAAGLGCAAACRYVAVTGSDASAGTKTAPWRTIQHAADVMNPGDTVIVNDGVYTGGANVVTITRSGTATAWFVFRAANRWGAIIDGQNNSSTTGFEINGNYIRVEGFEVRNTSRYAMETYGGREDIAGNHDVVLVQNHLHDVGHICTGTTGGIVGVSAYSDNLIIERNVIHDIGRLGPGEQGCVEPNANWQNHDHGIYNGVGNNVVFATTSSTTSHTAGRSSATMARAPSLPG